MNRFRPSMLLVAACAVTFGVAGVAVGQAAPQVSLGQVSVAGPVPTAEARGRLQRALPRVRRCYEDRLRERPELAGRMKVRLFVSSDGAPVVAQIDESDVGDDALGQCLERAVMSLAFSEHEMADSHVSFEVRFGDGRRHSGVPHTVSAGPDDPRFLGGEDTRALRPEPPAALRAVVQTELIDVSGSRAREPLSAALRRSMPRMRACYEDALSRNRHLAGDLRLRFKLDPRGHAREVSVEEDAVGDEALATCLGRTVESTRFEPAAGGDVEVVARVLLRPPVGLDEARGGRPG